MSQSVMENLILGTKTDKLTQKQALTLQSQVRVKLHYTSPSCQRSLSPMILPLYAMEKPTLGMVTPIPRVATTFTLPPLLTAVIVLLLST